METLNYRERRPPADSLAAANRQPVINIEDRGYDPGSPSRPGSGFACRQRKPRFLSDVQDELVKTLRIMRFTRWATGSGISPRFVSCWKISRLTTP